MGTRTPSFYTGTMAGTAGSLITVKDGVLITGEGWTSPFSGTNEKQYQQAGGNGFRLYVNDNATGAGLGREAIVRGCESSTALATLTDPFPTVALVADAACVWRKSDTADATNRPYWAVADDSFFCLVVQFATNSFDFYMFGDFEPFWTGDNYNTVINVRGTANSTTAGLAFQGIGNNLASSTTGNWWIARTASGTTKIDRAALMAEGPSTFGNQSNNTTADYPHPETLKFHMGMARLLGTGGSSGTPNDSAMFRGCLPFVMEAFHGQGIASMAPLDTFTDTAYDPSSSFIIFQENNSTTLATSGDRLILQTAGTWDPGY